MRLVDMRDKYESCSQSFSFFGVRLTFLLTLWGSSGAAFGMDQLNAYKVISIEGRDVPSALYQKTNNLSLAAIFDGEIEPIPFQIDEYNIGGAVFFPDWSVPMAGEIGVFDNTDRLLFVYKDAGPRRTNQRADGKVIAEIELTSKRGGKRYVYLMNGSRLRADEQYVRYSADDGLVETDFYSLTYNAENHLVWKDFDVFSYNGENPFDEMKLRFSSSIPNITLTNENITAEPKGTNVGPIRNTTQLLVTLDLLGVPLATGSMQLHHYPNSIIYDMRIVVPEILQLMIVDPKLTLSLDGNQLRGAIVRTALGPDQPGIVDGVIDDIEKSMIVAGAERTNNWIHISSQKQMDTVSFLDFLDDSDEPLSIVYVDDDDIQESSERFRGQLPNVGYGINGFPKSGLFAFSASLYISEAFQGDPKYFVHDLRSLPEIAVYSE